MAGWLAIPGDDEYGHIIISLWHRTGLGLGAESGGMGEQRQKAHHRDEFELKLLPLVCKVLRQGVNVQEEHAGRQ